MWDKTGMKLRLLCNTHRRNANWLEESEICSSSQLEVQGDCNIIITSSYAYS